MNVVTLKLPDALHTALQNASERRRVSKSAVIREALEQSLLAQDAQSGAAERWVAEWRGRLTSPSEVRDVRDVRDVQDPREAHLRAKHLR